MGEHDKNTKARQGKKAIKQISEENKALFEKYITPNLEDIKSLVMYYSDNPQDCDDNFIYTLEEFAKGVNTYNTSKPLHTWIHACVKHSCYRQNRKRSAMMGHRTGLALDMINNSTTSAPFIDPDKHMTSLIDSISDEVYDALMQIPPIKLSPFLLQVQGYPLKDIIQIEHERGNLEDYSENAIKGRIFWTRDRLKKILAKNGYRQSGKDRQNAMLFGETDD